MTQQAGRQAAAEQAAPLQAMGPLEGCACAAIVLVATLLRLFQLGRLSFWYDEVVTMRLARAGSTRALLELLFQIDATRAPLHPLLLHFWTRFFGSSEASARSLSVLCGIATVVLIFEIGRISFDIATGLWAAWLGSLSPLLIVYAREARMYAWLVLVTCLCWRLLLALRRTYTPAKAVAYVTGLTALVYSHPLGLLMLGALGLAGLIEVRTCFGTWRRWLFIHVGVVILILPWIGNYLDHPPEFLSGRLSPRFLLGTPISFIGGNSILLFGLAVLIALGLARRGLAHDAGTGLRLVRERWVAPGFLLLWLILPPLALYLYSWVSYPVFGPARYTVFAAPAYLVLVALGLSQMPAVGRYPLALGLAIVSALALGRLVYDPELRADWRGFAAAVAEDLAGRPRHSVVVIVASADPNRNVEVDTARYYLPAGCTVIGSGEASAARLDQIEDGEVYFAVGSRRQRIRPVPESLGLYQFRESGHYPGLIVYRGTR
ncbi:MAG: glycosyltransferase family 39 protein [Isosphaerales bacterium]